jgi:hypothetical protein
VETPAEAREALEAADTLGLTLREVKIRGAWEGRNGAEPSRGSTWQIDKIGRKWFHLTAEGYDAFAAKPRRSRHDWMDDGTLQLRFSVKR